MTIVEANSKLFEWFSKNDYFSIEGDFRHIVTLSETIEEDRICVKCALEDFEKMEFLKSSEIKGKKVWVLKKAFHAFDQTVPIDYEIANNIAQIINAFCDTIKDHTDQCDPASITKKDIKNILIICQHMSRNNSAN